MGHSLYHCTYRYIYCLDKCVLFLRIVNGTNYYQNLSEGVRRRRFKDDKLITLKERINNISHHLLISR